MSKAVERATAASVSGCALDIAGVVATAQRFNAGQLAAFGLHFLQVNYQALVLREGAFASLDDATAQLVEEKQWPPKSYLEARRAFDEKKKKEDSSEAGKGSSEKSGSTATTANGRKGKRAMAMLRGGLALFAKEEKGDSTATGRKELGGYY